MSGSRHPRPTSGLSSGSWVAIGLLAVLVVFLVLPGTPTSVRIASAVVAVLLGRRVWIDVSEVLADRRGGRR
ncbi:MAG: hypothetical protein U0Q15_01245 [Kineosporiaceae bacterium]